MSIVEKEVTRWELSALDVADLCRAERTDAIQLWWTPVDELKLYVLNVFSPRERIFWNVAEYRAFAMGAHIWMQPLVAREATIDAINGVIRDSGAPLKSELASELLGGLTRFFGDRYHPRDGFGAWDLAMGRHLSVAVPQSCQPMVSRYFNEQVRVFGESATRACPEGVALSYHGDESDPALARLLCDNIFLLSEPERQAQLALIRSGMDLLAQQRPEHFAFTDNAIAISTAGMELNPTAMSDFIAIARYRVATALRYYSLHRIEKLLKVDLANKGWGVLPLADLRDELRGQLGARLALFPVIETNPFELA